ncbi:MAG: PIN domain-containing protein [Acidobacteria bacterium]|nr:PIN domain-containing protein [Acidobacteriota bacterium]
MSDLILFDSNILVHLIRESAIGDYVRQRYQPLIADPRPMISVVTEGELRSLAHQWKWGKQKNDQMRFYLQHFWRVAVDTEDVFAAYAMIDAYSESLGHPMGKNDLWIAAAANATGAILVTTDTDFDHLQSDFLSIDWLDPEQFRPIKN